VRRALTALLLPEGLILLAAAAAVRWPALLAPVRPVLPWLPTIVVVAGVALALRFHRSGALFAFVVLAAAGTTLLWAIRARAAGAALGALEPALALLLPLNLLAFALLPERALASGASIRRLIALLAQAALLLVLARPEQTALWTTLTPRTFSSAVLPAAAPLGDPALLLFGVGIVIFAWRALRQTTPLSRGYLWALAATLLAFVVGPDGLPGGLPTAGVLLTAAGLSLVVALIETAHALAYRDALTGLPSRRALDDALHRLDGPFAIAMVDVDHFKSVNDTHGHDVGDQVLRMVAAQLDEVGAAGRAFRYGGEEFAILFPEHHRAEVVAALDAVRTAVAASRFTVRGADRPRRRPKQPRRRRGATELAVTVSIGVAERDAGDPDAASVITRADGALYRAKQAGRNRIEGGRTGRRG